MGDLNITLPHSIEAEQGIIGTILLDNATMITAAEKISEDDFYIEAHKLIFIAMQELVDEGKQIDYITLSNILKSKEQLDFIGGMSYLSSTMNMIPTTSNIKSYSDIVKEKSTLRKLIQSSYEIVDLAKSGNLELQDVLEFAEKKIFNISQENISSEFTQVKNVLNEVYSGIEEAYASGTDYRGLNSGFSELNSKIGGFQKSDLILLAARPGMGKTALSLNFVLNSALKENANIAVFSLEMSNQQLVQRLLSNQSNVKLEHIIKGRIQDSEWEKILVAMEVLNKLNIFIDDTPGIKMSEIRSKCRKLKIEKGLDLVMIDYLQLMEGDGKSENRQQEVSKISRALKILAKEMDCPVLALSQLSRKTEATSDHEPKLSDLRDSGAIEQDADIVMFIYREGYYDDNKNNNMAKLKIAKNRHGETGKVDLVWMPEIQRFGSHSR